MNDLLFSVRCTTKVRSAVIRGHVVMVDLGIPKLGFRMWAELPKDIFGLIADNHRKLREIGRSDYNMQDGRNVCKALRGREVRIRFTGRDLNGYVWRDAEILELV